jgi:hypothetical protein
MTFQRPTSTHEGIERARDIIDRIEQHDRPTLPEEVFREMANLSCWFDTEGMARRIHTLTFMLQEQVVELEDVPDPIFSLLLTVTEQAAQLADAIFVVDAIEYRLKKHELAEARAEQAKAKGTSKRRQKRREVTA